MTTMLQITNNMLAELHDECADILAQKYPEDVLNEYVDRAVPVYHSQLLSLLNDQPNLAYGPNDSGLLCANPSVWGIISAAVYEQLHDYATSWLDNEISKYNEEAAE